MKSDKAYILKLAKVLEEMFDMRFNRPWEDLPEDVQAEWIENAEDLLERMTGK